MTRQVQDKQEYVAACPEIGVAYPDIFGRLCPAMTAVRVGGPTEDEAPVKIGVTAVAPD
jgi:hypothetical protein